MSIVHTPTPWHHNGDGLIYGEPSSEEGAPFVANVTSDNKRAALGILTDRERADALFIVHACRVHDDLVEAMKLALRALNVAPRFRVGNTDSAQISALITAVGYQPA
jgi:hypothetical protein